MSQPTAPLVKETVKSSLTGFDAQIQALRISGTTHQKNLIQALDLYVDKMHPSQTVSEDEGARHQYNLWRALIFVIDQSPQDEFKKLWNIVLAYFEHYKQTVFHDRYVFRFSEFWQWSDDQLTALQRLINIIKLTSNQEDRAKGLKQVDLNRSLDTGITDIGRQKLVSFYKN